VGRAEIAGQTTMLVCDGDGVRGFLAVADEPRPESAAVVAELHRMGIVTALLSGDNPPAARAVGERLGMDDVRGGLLPEEKVAAVRLLAQTYGSAAMVGDGINDAPALAAASVGIAMGGAGSAQALESAAVVLMGDSLEKLPFTIRLARSVRSLIRQNIAFSLLTKLVFAILALAGITGMWVAVVGDSGIALLVTLNGLRAGRVKEL
jgi:Cd2+/Zn2+-exporting ATPase